MTCILISILPSHNNQHYKYNQWRWKRGYFLNEILHEFEHTWTYSYVSPITFLAQYWGIQVTMEQSDGVSRRSPQTVVVLDYFDLLNEWLGVVRKHSRKQ